MSALKILFLVKERLVYGTKSTCYGLVHSCEFIVNKLKEHGYEAKLEQVVDQNSIDKAVHHFKPTHCFIEALWVTPEKISELVKLHPKIHWIFRIHSMIPFLVTEGMCFDWMNQYMRLAANGAKISITCNNSKLFKDLSTLYSNVSYTPNIYYPCHNSEPYDIVIEKHSYILNVGCFGALRSLKNHAQQALWAIELANSKNKVLHFHVNVSEYETNETNPVLRNLKAIFSATDKHSLFEHTWLPHNNFLHLIKQMNFGLQISFTETFNIVAADFVSQKIPVVVSSEIDFVDPSMVVNASQPETVIEAMKSCLNQNNVTNIVNSNFNLLVKYNDKATKDWLRFLLTLQ